MIYLVHHAEAVGPEVEPQRPLSAEGRVHAEGLAAAAAARGVKPEVIWHSGKLRARQTAEPFLRLCNPLAEFAAIRGLQPTDPPSSINDLVTGETREILLVGHMPNSAARADPPRHRRSVTTPVVSSARRDRARSGRGAVD